MYIYIYIQTYIYIYIYIHQHISVSQYLKARATWSALLALGGAEPRLEHCSCLKCQDLIAANDCYLMETDTTISHKSNITQLKPLLKDKPGVAICRDMNGQLELMTLLAICCLIFSFLQ